MLGLNIKNQVNDDNSFTITDQLIFDNNSVDKYSVGTSTLFNSLPININTDNTINKKISVIADIPVNINDAFKEPVYTQNNNTVLDKKILVKYKNKTIELYGLDYRQLGKISFDDIITYIKGSIGKKSESLLLIECFLCKTINNEPEIIRYNDSPLTGDIEILLKLNNDLCEYINTNSSTEYDIEIFQIKLLVYISDILLNTNNGQYNNSTIFFANKTIKFLTTKLLNIYKKNPSLTTNTNDKTTHYVNIINKKLDDIYVAVTKNIDNSTKDKTSTENNSDDESDSLVSFTESKNDNSSEKDTEESIKSSESEVDENYKDYQAIYSA